MRKKEIERRTVAFIVTMYIIAMIGCFVNLPARQKVVYIDLSKAKSVERTTNIDLENSYFTKLIELDFSKCKNEKGNTNIIF